jgi:TolA-binding protein
MAPEKGQKDLLTRLSDAGEEALSRVAGSPATTRVLEGVGGMRDRLDDLQKKVRGLDELEKRVAKLEKRVEELAKPKRSTTATRSRAATAKRTTGSRPTTRRKPSENS